MQTFVPYPTKNHPAKVVESYAMAAINMPPLTYIHHLPQVTARPESLSDLQLDTVSYCGQRHEQWVNCEVPKYINAGTDMISCRGAYFIGDGTGIGKGRMIAGIISDNFHKGVKKALWVSVSKDLIKDARRDFSGIRSQVKLHRLNDHNISEPINLKEGTIFATYHTLIKKKKDNPDISRLWQLIEWFRKDNPKGEGVIVLDECHKLKNFYPDGRSEPTQVGEVGVILQLALPNCRVVYSSATGATDVRNMGYMVRLGLWGKGTNFPEGFSQFVEEIEAGGIGAMEMVCRDMKALGMYVSRSLSYEGVEYHEKYHELTPEQKKTYDNLAGLWRFILANIDSALQVTGASMSVKKTAYQNFWSNHQRFFSHLITAFKIPTLIEETEKWLKSNHSVVISLINTFEARTQDKVAKLLSEDKSLDDIDFTPKEIIYKLIENCFPTELHQETDKGHEVVRDWQGNIVHNREALKLKAELLDMIDEFSVPGNPLDEIIEYFGADNVAEITGRKRRLSKDSAGKVSYAKRAPNGVSMDKVNIHEMQEFQNGRKRIAIISDAASTGISLHCERTCRNQQRRVHITLQMGWSADKQFQTFGRVNRTNQVIPPIYVFIFTNIAGEKRFASTIARRLSSMGALTKGQADTIGNGNLVKYNFENKEGRVALRYIYEQIQNQTIVIPGIDTPIELLIEMGVLKEDSSNKLMIQESDYDDVTKFLNRLLSLDIDRQNNLFDKYTEVYDEIVVKAKNNGTYDEGVADLHAVEMRLQQAPVILHKDDLTKAETYYYKLAVDLRTIKNDWETTEIAYRNYRDCPHLFSAFVKHKKSGKIAMIYQIEDSYDIISGQVTKRYRKVTPSNRQGFKMDKLDKYELIGIPDARRLWQSEYDELPDFEVKDVHIVGGSILHVWNELKQGNEKLQIVRTEAGDLRIVGAIIEPEYLDDILSHFQHKPAISLQYSSNQKILIAEGQETLF